MLHYRCTLRDVDQGFCVLTALRGNSNVMMMDRDPLVARRGGRVHCDAFGAVADLHRRAVIANPYLFTGIVPRH